MTAWNDEKNLMVIILVASMFTMVVLSTTVGAILLGFALVYIVMVNSGGDRVFQFSRSGWSNKEKSLALIGAFFAIFLVAGGLLISYSSGAPFQLFSAVQLYSEQAVVPLTIQGEPIKVAIWGIIIPILETLFILGVVGKFLTRRFRVGRFDLQSLNMWIVVIIVGAVAALFHMLSQFFMEQALMVDWLFFSVSMLMVIYRQELKEAGVLHIIMNTAGLALAGGWFVVAGI